MAQPQPQPSAPAPPVVPYDLPCRRIQVSREKRPLNFFVTLSKKFLVTDQVVVLSGLGLAVTTVVTIAEILRTDGYVSLDHIQTSLVEPHPDGHTTAPKAKIQIWIRKTPQFDSLMTNHNSHYTRPHNNPPTSAPGGPSSESPAATTLEAGNTNPAPTPTPPVADTPADPQPASTSEDPEDPAAVPQPALQGKS